MSGQYRERVAINRVSLYTVYVEIVIGQKVCQAQLYNIIYLCIRETFCGINNIIKIFANVLNGHQILGTHIVVQKLSHGMTLWVWQCVHLVIFNYT